MTYVLMKVLESAPQRYDKGIRLLTRGSVDKAYDFLADHIQAGQRVLDIGCGTGALTLRAAARGATVIGIDINPQMLSIAQQRLTAAGLNEQVELRELGVAELESEPAASFDVVMSGLCFSELSSDERRYALAEARRLLRPGGLLLLADETLPAHPGRRLLHALIRLPLVVITYLLTQTTTRPVAQLPQLVEHAGFTIRQRYRNSLHDFTALVAETG